VTVPLRHADPDGPTIRLAVVVLPAVDADPAADPLFMAQGGPGASTIDTFAEYLATDNDLRPTTNRDIVLWDQRGTLYSSPFLHCPEVLNADLQSVLADATPPPDDYEAKAYEACGTRLSAEAGDLSAFNSSENADDVEDVRVALGYDQINFYGVSYGTELGQFLMRQQPDHLRSVVLDAVVPLSYNLFTEPIFAKEHITERYFADCAEDARCNAAYPDLSQRYFALIDRLDENPVEVTVVTGGPFGRPPGPEKSHQINLDGSLLDSALFQSLYTDVHDLVPLIIDQADKGSYTYLASALLPVILFDDTMSEGMWFTVECADRGDTDLSTLDLSGLDPQIAAEERDTAEEELAVCDTWNVDLLPRTDLNPVISDIPTLLLSGSWDPITPPQYAEQLLPTLTNANHVIFTDGAHGQAGLDPCANRIIASFLDDPMGDLDASCADHPVSDFVTPADIIALPALQRALDDFGLSGLLRYAYSLAPSLLIGLCLLTAIPVYAIGWLTGRFRRRQIDDAAPDLLTLDGAAPDATTSDWTKRWSQWAPWLGVIAALLILSFVGLLGLAIATTLAANEHLVLLGAIPAVWRPIFALPPLFVALVALMVVAAVALWAGHRRTPAGRIYYALLTLTGLAGVVALYSAGFLGIGFGE